METIKDYNNDGELDYKDYIFYGLAIVSNIVVTLINVLH